jgi:hypothetical protein
MEDRHSERAIADQQPQPEGEGPKDMVRDAVAAILADATAQGAAQLGTTRASIVMIGLGIWIEELAHLDRKATMNVLHAMGDIIDPASNGTKRKFGERRRERAVDALFAAMDKRRAGG